jgi:hypothetical protein
MSLLKVFIGYDARQPIAFNVLQHSIISQSSKPVAIIPLVLEQLAMQRTGLTPFTFTRFLVPHLCDYQGWALFLDIDMLVKGDIAKLFDFADDRYAVMVSKNQHRFEWASAMLFNCAKNTILTEDYIRSSSGLHGINWVPETEVGEFPGEWNHLVGYDEPIGNPKLIHYTQGIPLFPETKSSDYAQDWEKALQAANTATNWNELMGNSIHAEVLPDGRRVPKFVAKRMREDAKTATAAA